jgi:hypothetical protein
LGCKVITNNIQNHYLNDFCINSIIYDNDLEINFNHILEFLEKPTVNSIDIKNQELEFKNFLIG